MWAIFFVSGCMRIKLTALTFSVHVKLLYIFRTGFRLVPMCMCKQTRSPPRLWAVPFILNYCTYLVTYLRWWQTRLCWRLSVTPFNKCFHEMVSVTSRRAGCLSSPGTTSHSTRIHMYRYMSAIRLSLFRLSLLRRMQLSISRQKLYSFQPTITVLVVSRWSPVMLQE